ncbi:MAG: hypothetical protein M1598_07015, partial [Actinobacteria bacterium]|nr:hypothetical protein [Actinomycetota bacterium]
QSQRRRRPDFTREQAAGLAPVVTQVARAGDRVALDIMRQAGEDLGELAVAVIERLGMAGEQVPVVLTGGVAAAGDLIGPILAARVKGICPDASFPVPRYEPAIGAVILALETAGIRVDDRVKERLDRGTVQQGPRTADTQREVSRS